ncbi:MAG: anti-sigma factor [Pedobacter sp.]|nr:anti-sigma factor [Pedobacter sp.]
MNYDSPELQHRLAAEYVLGSLQGPARRRFEKLLAANDGLQCKVRAWELRLAPWAAAVKPVAVPRHVWARIQYQLFLEPSRAREQLPEPSRFWNWWAWGSTALAAAFALVLVLRPAAELPPPLPVSLSHDLAVLSTDKAEAVWIVRSDGAELEFSGLSAVSVPAGRDLELWAIPVQGAPRSLGVVKLQGDRQARVALTAELKARMADGVALAISLEPAGGSTTGAPTGPVLYSGKLQG